MKRQIWLVVSLLLVAGLLVGALACGPTSTPTTTTPKTTASPPPTTTSSPIATTTPSPTTTVKPITIKMSLSMAAETDVGKGYKLYMDDIEKRSNGRIKFEPYWSNSLLPVKEVPQSVGSGISQMGQSVQSYYPSTLPISQVMLQPAIGRNYWSTMHAGNDFYNLDMVQKEFAALNTREVGTSASSGYSIISKKPVKTIEDFKGLRVLAAAGRATMIQLLGGVPVGIAAAEGYEALQKGTIDAVFYPTTYMPTYKFQEVAKYYTNLEAETGYTATSLIVINLDFYKSLPSDLQQVISGSDAWIDAYSKMNFIDAAKDVFANIFPKAGVTVVEMSQADKDKFVEIAVKPALTTWVNDAKKAGLPADDILKQWTDLNRAWDAKIPSQFK